MFRRPGNAYGETPAFETPYQRAGQVWDRRLGGAYAQARNWRWMAFLCLVFAGAMTGAFVWQGGRSQITPYIVEVDSSGEARAIGAATEPYTPSDAQIAYALARFIENIRSLSLDPVVVRRNWLRAYDYATSDAAATLNDYARQNDPFADIGDRTVTVDITSVVRASADSFDVRWREQTFVNGTLADTARYNALLTTTLQPPQTEEALRRNPLGIYVRGLNWSRDIIAGDTP